MKPFVHLHVHTEFSLLDGAARIGKLVKTVKEMGMNSVAITDHGNMYGTIAFFDECKKQGVKPIFGCEFYVCEDLTVKAGKTKLAHLILLAKNQEGYKNLCMLNTIAFRDGFYYKPRIDYKVLKQYSKGLICLSACLAGDLPQLLLKSTWEKAKEYALMMKEMFEPGDYYIEVQDHGILEEKEVVPKLFQMAKEIGVKTVATNDVHYIYKEDAEMQDVLMCVQMGKTVDDPDRLKFDTEELYLKSGDEMAQLFDGNDECIETTLEIAEKCNCSFENIDKNHYLFPRYIPENGQQPLEFLKGLIEKGLKQKYGEITKDIHDRVEHELSVIVGQGFVEYFLIVWDYIDAARRMGIPVGPGRGSGAGSIVAYSIGITNIDPLKYDLLFERFLHTERVTAPDFDVDFADDRRGDVIEYVRQKYGENRVVKIVTFGTMAAKNAIKDVGRVLSVPYSELDKITKNIPNIPAKHHDVIKKCFGFYHPAEDAKDYGTDYAVADLVQMYESSSDIKKVIDIAMKVEGMPRQCSTHACGVVIGAEALDKHMPLSRNGEDITTQYNMTDIERLGHLKMDFLGLRNLNDISRSIEYIKQNYGIEIDFDKMSYDDPEVFKLISTGNTKAIFQIESSGFQKFMKDLKPTSIEDITAGVSLYRPGPMDSIPRYVHNKHNPQDVTYAHPILENVLNVTYGCIVYQEQVMRIVQDMAGYTLGQADMVRRMMGKKKLEAMQKEKAVFLNGRPASDNSPAIDGAIKRGVPRDVAEKIWGEMESFASYAFNKSHAAAYSLITYQTAYLKCYYEPEFLTAVLNNRITNSDEIKNYVSYARQEGIEVLPPDINKSEAGFSVQEKNKMRFGLAALKNVGLGLITTIVEERNKNGDYKNFMDFARRVDSQALNKRCLESLILSGAFDCFGVYRSQLMQVYDMVVERVIKDKKTKASGQFSFFDNVSLENDIVNDDIEYPNIKEFNKDAKLKFEKEVVGIYISGHPLDAYLDKFKQFNLTSDKLQVNEEEDGVEYEDNESEEEIVQQSDLVDGMSVKCGGIISEVKKIILKKDRKEMAFVTIEDIYGTFEVAFFPTIYSKFKNQLLEDSFVTIIGKLSFRDGKKPTVLVSNIIPWEKREEEEIIDDNASKTLYLKFDIDNLTLHSAVENILNSYPGTSGVVVKSSVTGKAFSLKNRTVLINNYLLNELNGIIESQNIIVR